MVCVCMFVWSSHTYSKSKDQLGKVVRFLICRHELDFLHKFVM